MVEISDVVASSNAPAQAEVLLQRARLAARDLEHACRRVREPHDPVPRRDCSSATTFCRLTSDERWMRKKSAGGSASSSSRSDWVER